jgi:uncharacterized membrane protein YidH (DUF202 family)
MSLLGAKLRVPTAVGSSILPALLEGTWLSLVALGVQTAADTGRPPPWPLFVLASLCNQVMARLPGDGTGLADRIMAGLLGLATLGALAGWPPNPAWLALGLVLLWRARGLADFPHAEERLRNAVRAALVGTALSLVPRVFVGTVAPEVSRAQLASVVVLAILSLLALARAQQMELAATYEASEPEPASFSAAPLGIAAIAGGSLVLLVIVPLFARIILFALSQFVRLVALVLTPVLTLIAYLLFTYIFSPLIAWLQPKFGQAQASRLGGLYSVIDQLQQRNATPPPAYLHTLVEALGLLLLLAIIAMVLARVTAKRRAQERLAPRSGDTRTSLWSWDGLVTWLRRLFRRPPIIAASVELASRVLRRPAPITMTARGVYRDIVRRADHSPALRHRRSVERRVSETAAEFCAVLSQVIPVVEHDAALLAQWYADERYGGLGSPPPPTMQPLWSRMVVALETFEEASHA